MTIDLSIVVPVYNEEDNVARLHAAVVTALADLDLRYELVLVDDGSRDATLARAAEIAREDPRLRVVALRRNFGQTPATVAGFQVARGRLIVTMDGDLQNDPTDIPRVVALLDEGYDIVAGWRRKRQDGGARVFVSKVANKIMANLMGTTVRDSGCSLKGYHADLIQNLPLYGEMHRFIPALSRLAGAKLAQIEVKHHPRQFGVSKYGFSRIYKVMLDLISVRVLLSYARRPFHWVSGISAAFLFAALAVAAAWPFSSAGSYIVLVTGIVVTLLSTSIFFVAWGLFGLLFAGSEKSFDRYSTLAAVLAARVSAKDSSTYD